MKSFHRILFSLTVGCAAILGLTPEVRAESIISVENGGRSAHIRTNHQLEDYPVENLVDNSGATFYCSGLDKEWTEGAYIEIDVASGILNPDFVDTHLIVYVRRSPDDWNESHRSLIDVAPTTFKVVGLFDGYDENVKENWCELFYTYLLYRGPSTEEYSCRISIPKLWRTASANPDAHRPEDMDIEPKAWYGNNTPRQLKKMRFYVTANHNRDKQENDFRAMSMAEFDVIKIGVNGSYPNGFKDRFHRDDDYKRNYENFKFVNTQGIIDSHNSVAGWEDLNALERETVKNATKTAARPNGVDIPSFEFLTPETSEYKLNERQVRQAAHTVEHILYAIPGDAIALYPYYSLYDQGEYQENFSHWYDYRTGGRLKYTAPWSEIEYDLLDFIVDPSQIQITENFGFYGGKDLCDNNRKCGTYATFFCPRNPYIEGGVQHNLPFEAVYGDESSDEFIICADYSQEFDISKNVKDEANELYEPLIAFRHIFRIRDGKTFAEEFSGSAEQNREYVRRNRKYASARADVPFQIRLDSPVPKKKEDNENSQDKARSTYYYKISDEEYRRVCSMDIRVLDAATREVTDQVKFQFGEAFKGQGTRIINGVNYVLCGGNQEYYRMLTCPEPKEGEYIVQLIGLDVDYKPIKVYGSEEGLIVMEYDISFLPTSAAAMLTESELYAQDSKFKKMRPDELAKAYGEPKVSIDFDEYMGLNDLEENLRNKVIGNQEEHDGLKQQYFKWPVPWDLSNYAFGYNHTHDYNMYRLITHSKDAPFKSAVDNKRIPDEDGGLIGLYDRKFYDSYRARKTDPDVPLEQGYYYYVNASSDPGVMQRLSINELCQGATVHVSAWMAELTGDYPEVANISFNFVAVLNDELPNLPPNSVIQPGDRIRLHSFISGYIPNFYEGKYNEGVAGATSAGDRTDHRGEWLYVYYSFVPQLSEFSSQGITADMVDHYELELDNNSKSSAGADYAIDDIRVYIVSPTVYASQHEPLCDATSTPIKVEVPFQTLIQSVGYKETIGDDAGDTVDMYYTFIDKEKFDAIYSSDNGAEAFEKSVVRFNYDSKDETVIDRMFGKVSFTTNYYKLDEYNYNKENPETGLAMRDIVDGERLVVFDSQLTDKDIHPGMQYYVLLKNTLAPDTDPDLDTAEKVWSFFDMMDKCAKKVVLTVQSSNVIKVDGQLAPDNNSFTVCENQSPVVQINISGMYENEETTTLIHNAYIDWFDGLLSEYMDYKDEDDDDHTLALAMETFRSIDTEASDLNEFNANGSTAFEDWMHDIIQRAIDEKKLFLRQSSYVFPPVSLKDGENEKECHVVAIPIPFDYDKEYTVCLNPTQVNIRVQNKAPLLSHGLTGIEYPALLTDVPLRIGIDQILHASAAADAYGDKGVVIPIRNVASSDNDTRAMSLKGEGTIILVQTNDPVYKDLGTIDDKGYETGSLLDIGIVVPDKFKAEIDGDDNQFVAVFDDDFTFREGYYYRMRFHYQETADADSDNEVVCDGQDVFTLKVVPRFLRWTGEEGLNWNNDANWTRVDSKELATSEDRRKDEYNRYLTDGENNRQSAYAPLEFTSVIIPGDREAPYLYAPEFSSVGKWNDWTEKPSEIAGNYEDKVEGEELGNATEDIQYDMVAYPRVDRLTDDNNIYCRPWYVNTCRDIHFRPSAAIMNQHELHYEKAWVDFELDHSRWYTLSTPLKVVYAGDFYLPIDNARQETELFEPIVFDDTLEKNDRFKPAVFQRGWDKGMATVYELDGGSRDVAVRTSWSHVYNDVEEIYGSGTGFSVKTDVSRMGDGKPGDGDKVLFRLPKADDTYKYYSLDGKTNVDHDATVSRENTHLLNDAKGTVTARSMGSSSLFLVGNPFITDMDLARFIKHNVDKIKPNYWIVTADGQETGTITDDGAVGTAAPRVAPFQGFFVEAVNPVENLTLEYDESMMLRRHKTGDEPVGVRSHGDRMSALKVNAVTSGHRTSSALILDASDYGSDVCDVMALDNRSLDVESVVYTVKSGRALAINFADSLNGTEIGVIADDDSETTLEFTGTEMAGKLYLYDRVDESYTPLREGMTYNVTGAAVGRLYITDGADIDALPSGIQLVTDGNSVTVRDGAQSGTISVEVFDTLGHQVLAMTDGSSELTFTLPRGFYIVKVATAKEDTIAKIKI